MSQINDAKRVKFSEPTEDELMSQIMDSVVPSDNIAHVDAQVVHNDQTIGMPYHKGVCHGEIGKAFEAMRSDNYRITHCRDDELLEAYFAAQQPSFP
jgi:hypothetical protein